MSKKVKKILAYLGSFILLATLVAEQFIKFPQPLPAILIFVGFIMVVISTDIDHYFGIK